jgi:hypothetical protein
MEETSRVYYKLNKTLVIEELEKISQQLIKNMFFENINLTSIVGNGKSFLTNKLHVIFTYFEFKTLISNEIISVNRYTLLCFRIISIM